MLCRSMIFVVPLRLGCVQHDRQTFFYVPLNENLVVAILLILSIVAFVQVDFDDAAFFFVQGQTWAWVGWRQVVWDRPAAVMVWCGCIFHSTLRIKIINLEFLKNKIYF